MMKEFERVVLHQKFQALQLEQQSYPLIYQSNLLGTQSDQQ